MKISGTLVVLIIGMIIGVSVVILFFYGWDRVERNIYLPIVLIMGSAWMIFTVKYLRKKI